MGEVASKTAGSPLYVNNYYGAAATSSSGMSGSGVAVAHTHFYLVRRVLSTQKGPLC